MTASAPEMSAESGFEQAARTAGWGEAEVERAGLARWELASVITLLSATALLYLWNLGASGWANAFYSAAVEAGSKSWSAFFFGSFDSSNFITVDKPPAALWIMDLSSRMFGVNAWSILVPQALEGVAAVGLLYATVRRWFSPVAALLAGAVLALTPVAALMFRFNNPDALLVLLMVASAYALTRSLENGSTRWLLFGGVLLGFGFLAKMLQAFIIVPPFALVYLIAAPVSLRRRLVQLVAYGISILISAGWWVAAMVLIPANARPYVGGSQDNSILNLIFGYNGFGRITGNEAGSVVGGPQRTGGGRWGPTGLLRMFETDMASQISWLLPAALIAFVALLWFTWRTPRTDHVRAAAIMWGGWLIITDVVFSLAQGIIHPYYTVALAPAIGALVGIGATQLWQHRNRIDARLLLAVGVAISAFWAVTLLDRSPNWYPQLRIVVIVAGVAATALLLLVNRLPRQASLVIVAVALIAILAGPSAYAAQTAATAHSGALPTAGPAVANSGPGGRRPRGVPNGAAFGGNPPGGFSPFGGSRTRSNGGFPNGNFSRGLPGNGSNGTTPAIPNGANGARNFGGGSLGGLLDAREPDPALVWTLEQNSDKYTWVAAIVGANNSAGVQLATGEPVMAIGGFNGTDPTPTLAQFQQYVQEGKIHYFIASGGGFGGRGRPGGDRGTSSQITSWVEQNFSSQTVGGSTVYDLTKRMSVP